MLESCKIRTLTEEDLPMLLAWRNHSEVRRCMLTQHEITLEEHYAWFAKASVDKSRQLLIVENGKLAVGFVQFSQVAEFGIANWGFYLQPDLPKGSGHILGAMALTHAFSDLKLHKVCGQAIAGNGSSIAFHQRMGFRLEGILRDQNCINGAYHNLHCFGLLLSEWRCNNPSLER